MLSRSTASTSPRFRAISPSLRAKLFLPAVLVVFTASGFARLIYESIWSHYLKLHLARSTREGLWQRLSSSGCARGPADTALWLRLHAAIAGEDAGGVVRAAQALLQDDLSPDLAPYVIAAHMTGLLLGNDRAGALRSFQVNRRKLGVRQETWEPVFRFLIGQTAGG